MLRSLIKMSNYFPKSIELKAVFVFLLLLILAQFGFDEARGYGGAGGAGTDRDSGVVLSGAVLPSLAEETEKAVALIGIQKEDAPAVLSVATAVSSSVSSAIAPIANRAPAAGAATAAASQTIAMAFKAFPVGVYRRKKKWGIVVDAQTLLPITGVHVNLMRQADSKSEKSLLAASAYSDNHGEYGFVVPAGNYSIELYKDSYRTTCPDTTYYKPGALIKVEDPKATIRVPAVAMEMEVGDEQIVRRSISRLDWTENLFNYISLIMLGLGSIVIINRLLGEPSWANTVWLVVYLILWAAWLHGAIIRSMSVFHGNVLESKTGLPVADAIIRVVDLDRNSLTRTAVTDSHGIFTTYLPHENCKIIASKIGYTPQEPLNYSVRKGVGKLGRIIYLEKI